MVHADTRADEPREGLAEARGELEVAERRRDRGLLLLVRERERHQRLRAFGGGLLREMDDVDGCLVRGDQFDDLILDRHGRVREVQRYRTFRAGHEDGLAPRPPREVLLEEGGVAERRGHEHELCAGSSMSGTCHAQPRSGSE